MCRLSAGAGQCRQSAVEASRHATRHAAPRRATLRRDVPRQGRVDDVPLPLFFFFFPPARLARRFLLLPVPPPARVRAGRRATYEAYASKIRACRRCRRASARRASVLAASRAHGGKERKAVEERGLGERRGEGRIPVGVPARARKSHGNLPTTARRDPPAPPTAARRFSSRKRFAERSQAGCLRR